MWFPHQIEQHGQRRPRVEPLREPSRIDDRRLSMVDVFQAWGGLRGNDGEGLEWRAAGIPALPQRGERQRRAVLQGQVIGLLAAPSLLSLEPAIDRQQAAA